MYLKRAANQLNRKVDFDILTEYSDPLQYIYINDNDKDLQKWRIEMPEPPNWDKIHNFGKPAMEQMFEYEIYPLGLKNLENKVRDTVQREKTKKDSNFTIERTIYERIWEILEVEHRKYEEEIEWMRSQWRYREFGKWMFIQGKPYLITGDHWYYLNYFPLMDLDTPNGLPNYRYRDFKWYWAQKYLEETDETVYYDVNGKQELLEDGTLRMIKTGSRTILGSNNLKGRRVGETSKVSEMGLNRASSRIDFYGGIQGNSDDTASDVYTAKLLYAYNKQPFFFVPKVANFYFTSELNFTDINQKEGLNSKIQPATTAKKEFFDGKKLRFLHIDEAGKTLSENIIDRHGVIKKCLMEGSRINGFLVYTSTAEDMDAESGQRFEELSLESMFEERLPNGQTISGLVNVYFPHWESYNDFIDPYGFPIVDTPKDYQIKSMGKIVYAADGHIMGAKEYLETEESAVRAKGDLRKLAQLQRQNPKSFRECFALASMNQFFNTDLLQARHQEIIFSHDKRIKGNFYFEGAKYDSRVNFRRDENGGKFYVTMQLQDNQRSLTAFNGMYKEPAKYNDVFISSADTYRLEKTDSYRFSLGSYAVLYKYDPSIDTSDKLIKDYTTSRFVCTYVNKPLTKQEYLDDCLMASIYYNSPCFPEGNIDDIQRHFTDKGYKGYLSYKVDPVSGKINTNAGWTTAGTGGNVKIKMFNLVADWINKFADKCDHQEIIEELLRVRGIEDMKNRDLFVSIAGCLMAEEMSTADIVKRLHSGRQTVDWKEWV
jgi:hypothetical protein